MSRIALIGPSRPQRGGIAPTTTSLAVELERRGALVAFETPRRQYPAWLYPGRDDREPDAGERLPFARADLGVLEPWSWPRVIARLERSAPDVLAIPYWTWAWGPLWLAVLRRVRVPAVAIVHNPADHDASALSRLVARRVLAGWRNAPAWRAGLCRRPRSLRS